jgi:ABC-2 type transport system permease protein
MKNWAIYTKSLFDTRRSIIGWTIGIILYTLMVTSIFPSIANDPAYQEISESYPESIAIFFEGIDQLTEPANYLNVQLFSLVPVILGIFAVLQGLSAINGEERNQSVDTLVTLPIPRWQIVTQKFLATATALFVIVTGYFLTLIGSVIAFPELDISIWRLALACYMMLLPLLAITGVAYLASAALPASRRLGAPITAAFLVGSYLINNLANAADVLEPLKLLSVFNYYKSLGMLTDSFSIIDTMVLLVAIGALYAATAFSFERRDLGA